MVEKPNKIIASRDLTTACIPILLNAYKHGIFIADNPSAKFDELKELQYVGYYHETKEGQQTHVLWLTQRGADFVEAHFIDFLEQTNLMYIYPIVKSGDIIEVVQNIVNSYDEKRQEPKKFVSSPSHSSCLEKGLYPVQSIDSTSVVVTDDMSVPYRLKLAKVTKMVRFVADELGDDDAERRSRIGKIRVKSIVAQLQDRIDSLTMIEIVDTLYEMPHTKDRIQNE